MRSEICGINRAPSRLTWTRQRFHCLGSDVARATKLSSDVEKLTVSRKMQCVYSEPLLGCQNGNPCLIRPILLDTTRGDSRALEFGCILASTGVDSMKVSH